MANYDPKRGAPKPNYSQHEEKYRGEILNNLQRAYQGREQPQMELDERSYSQYYLINRQADMGYNPPKNNPMDSRIVTGIVHEKNNTIESLVTSMNLQPKVSLYDEDDQELQDFSMLLTAKLKKSLKQEMFSEKLAEYVRVNVAQGNVFIAETKKRKISVNKNIVGDKLKGKITTEIIDEGEVLESMLIPNTCIYFPNLLEPDLKKQPYIYMVMHMPRHAVEQQYKDFPMWKHVPKYPTMTTPMNESGNWGDYYLQQPREDYIEVIMYQNKLRNEYNVFLNGVMMYPVEELKDGDETVCIGYPLTEFSSSGEYTIVKGDNERIPFYAYGKSNSIKNEVKETIANELLRIMIHKMRYSSFPTLGNNSDKVLTSDIWAPATVIPDIRQADVEVLFPNMQINQADFSFYQLIMQSIDETSVSKSIEGTNNEDITATQYIDQKKENLKKLGLIIDGVMNFLRDFYWLRLYNEIENLDRKKKVYSVAEQKEVEVYESFTLEDTVGGQGTELQFNFTDEITETPESIFKKEFESSKPIKSIYLKPKQTKEIIKKLRNKLYIDVVSEPEGQNQSLLGILFNILAQYSNLRGGVLPNLNFEYLDKIISQNSGFDASEIFKKMQEPMVMPQMAGLSAPTGADGLPTQPTQAPQQPQNSVLANQTNTLSM